MGEEGSGMQVRVGRKKRMAEVKCPGGSRGGAMGTTRALESEHFQKATRPWWAIRMEQISSQSGAGAMTPWLRALAVLTEEQD